VSVAAATGGGLASMPAAPGGARLRVLFALPGLHRVWRGAEIAFESVASELALRDGIDVTLMGSGEARADRAYRFVHVPCSERERFERWPKVPPLRGAVVYEELSFARELRRVYRPADYDVTVTCAYPFTNWLLRRGKDRPAHVFVTQNGDWPAQRRNWEYRLFGCDALVCTNPVYYERHKASYTCALIPNGVDPSRFGPGERADMEIAGDGPLVLIVAALIPSKRVVEGIRAAAGVPGVRLLVVGDGPLRDEVDRAGREMLGERFRRAVVGHSAMPEIYRSADVLLHMSKDEPFGNVYIEAMACGTPVVAHRTPSTAWIMGEHGALVDTDEPPRIAEAIGSESRGENLQRRAERARAARERFGWSRVAGQYEAVLREAALKRQGAR
jgi:glycosyltransferase involved in cell wall biosynthesis